MPGTFLIADTHFGHAGVTKFLRDDGKKLRPWSTPDEMDHDMTELWNAAVTKKDLVYILGDVVINRRCLPILRKLNGEKVLIKGNHDMFRIQEYTKYFKDVRACSTMAGYILTHIPIHPCSVGRYGVNIHGHLHDGRVKLEGGGVDKRYMCVSAEHINFRPILLERLIDKIKAEQLAS